VIVENRPAPAATSAPVVARASRTAHLAADHLAVHPERPLFKSVPYDPVADFAPIVQLVEAALAVHPSVPATSAGFRRLPEGHRRAQLRLPDAARRTICPWSHSSWPRRPTSSTSLIGVGTRRAGSGWRPRQRNVHSRPCRPAVSKDNQIRLLAVANKRASAAPTPTLPEQGISVSRSISGWGYPRPNRPRRLLATTAFSTTSCARPRSPRS
jgi:hypothetical protein